MKTTAIIFAMAAEAAFGATAPAPYISLDLGSGQFETLDAKPVEWTFADYETRIVFEYGGLNSRGNPYYRAAFDTTVAQWANVMGGTDDEKTDDSTKTGVTKREIRGLLPDALIPITYGSFVAALRSKTGLYGFELYDRDNPAGTADGFKMAYFPAADKKAFTVEVDDPGDGETETPIVVPSAANLAAWLELPATVYPGETATGTIVYSNRLDDAAIEAPSFTLSAGGTAAFADGSTSLTLAGTRIAPSGADEIPFQFTAPTGCITLSFFDATQSAAPATAVRDAPAASAAAPLFAAILPEGPAPLTTGFVFLGDGRKIASLAWDFDGDGETDCADFAPVWTFDGVGSHPVAVRAVYADGATTNATLDAAVEVWDAPETEYDPRTILVGAALYDYSIESEAASNLVLRANGTNPRAVSAGSIILRHGKLYTPLKATNVVETNDGSLSVDVEPCALTEAYSVLSISSLFRPSKSGTQNAEIYSLPDFDKAFSIAMGEAVSLDMTLTNTLSFASSIDIRTVNGVRRVKRFYGGIAGAFGIELATSLKTPDGLVSGTLADATVNFGTPPLLIWAGPKATYSANAGADLSVTAKGRFAKGVKYSSGTLTHVGGAVLEDFDKARDVKCPLAFADVSLFAGLEIGAALGLDILNGSLSATVLAVSADAGVRADAMAETADGVRSLDLKVRPVVELSFVPVSLNVFDVVDWTPVVKNHAVEGPAWTFHWDDAAAGANINMQSLPVTVVAAGETESVAEADIPASVFAETGAADWLGQNGLSSAGMPEAAMRTVMERPSGKRTADGNLAPIWHDYIAGTNPKDENDVFHASISIDAGGNVTISPHPDMGDKRVYTVEGKESLDGEWHPQREGDRFFRIKVELE